MYNLWTKTKKVWKRDANGNLWEATVLDEKKPDLGELWKSFTDSLKQGQEHKESLKGPGVINIPEGYVEREAEKQLNEKQ